MLDLQLKKATETIITSHFQKLSQVWPLNKMCYKIVFSLLRGWSMWLFLK